MSKMYCKYSKQESKSALLQMVIILTTHKALENDTDNNR